MIVAPIAASLDLEEAGAFLGLHPDTVRERAAAGKIPGAKLGKEWRFLDVDLAAHMRSQYRCHSTDEPEVKSGTSIFATAAAALDDLLALPIAKPPNASMMSLQLVPGKSARTAKGSPTPSSPGTPRSRASRARSGH